MNALVNIIHPYTYKIFGESNIIGSVDEYSARDEKLTQFVSQAIGSGARIIIYRLYPKNSIERMIHDAGFKFDPFFRFLFNKRVNEVTLGIHGVPLLREYFHEDLPEEVWRGACKIYLTDNGAKGLIGNSNPVFFIGGVLENCVANFANYWIGRIRPQIMKCILFLKFVLLLTQYCLKCELNS